MNLKNTHSLTLEELCTPAIGALFAQNKIGTARNYEAAFESLSHFCDPSLVQVADICPLWVRDYNAWLEASGNTPNTISFYNRILRALFNRAVRSGRVKQTFPFREAYTGNDRTRKRALDVGAMRRIAFLDCSDNREICLARDVFLFSFYARGMSFVDMAYLTEEDIDNGVISYCRKKTGARLMLKVEPCMWEIVERYRPQSAAGYVFPYIRSSGPREAYGEYRYGLSRCNLMLKEIGRRAGIPFPLNTYVARHTWATLARNQNIPLSVISAGMGHSSENTTRIYLDTLPGGVLDEANHQLLTHFFSSNL